MRLGQFISVASGFFPSVPPTPPVVGAWDLTYAAFNGGELGVFYPGGTWPERAVFSPDGTKLYVMDVFWEDILQYSLSTAGDITTAVYDTEATVGSQLTSLDDVVFSTDGTKMYAYDGFYDTLHQYDLSTAWAVNTIVYSSKTLVPLFAAVSFSFKSDGTEVTFFSGKSNTRYLLSTPWDLSTATFDGTIGPTGGLFTGATSTYAVSFSPNGLKMHNLTSSSLEEYDLGTAWDLATASYVQSFSLLSPGYNNGLYFRSDGLKFYTVEYANDNVYEYDLTTAWDLSTASYSTKSFSVSAQESTPQGVFFKPDGLKMYVVGYVTDSVYEYDLSTAWDVSTASYNSKSFSVSAQESTPQGVFFKPDGTMMFITGSSGDDVNAYTLSTAWDVTTASFSASNSVFATGRANPTDLFFDPTGTYLYISVSGWGIAGHTLSTPWDISTLSSDITGLYDFYFGSYCKITPDGNYVLAHIGNTFYRNPLSTAWDITTQSTATSGSLPVTGTAYGFAIYSDANKLIRTSDPTFVSYTMTGGNWNVSTAVWDGPTSNYFEVINQESFPTAVVFKDDGLKMYVIGASGDDINEYNLGTAWDVTTATFFQNASISAQERTPYGMFFKPDGTKMYVLGQSGDDVNEYNLGTAWDISTLTFVQSFLVSSTSPRGVYFRADGLRMYATGGGSSNAEVMEHTLSTAWDVSTAVETHSLNLYISPYSYSYPAGVFFKPDGTKMFLSSDSNYSVSEWDLTTPWDLSTATPVDIFDVDPYMLGNTSGLFFKPDGTQMALVTYGLDAVYTFDVRE